MVSIHAKQGTQLYYLFCISKVKRPSADTVHLPGFFQKSCVESNFEVSVEECNDDLMTTIRVFTIESAVTLVSEGICTPAVSRSDYQRGEELFLP